MQNISPPCNPSGNDDGDDVSLLPSFVVFSLMLRQKYVFILIKANT